MDLQDDLQELPDLPQPQLSVEDTQVLAPIFQLNDKLPTSHGNTTQQLWKEKLPTCYGNTTLANSSLTCPQFGANEKKRKTTTEPSKAVKILEDLTSEIEKRKENESESESMVFAKFVVIQLDSLSKKSQLMTKKKITDILYEANMAEMDAE